MVADASRTDLYDTHLYDAVLCTEFLEHVECDTEILSRIRSGVVFYGSVPSFPSASHVRHFASADQVAGRYAALFQGFRIDPFLVGNNTFFVIEGVKV